MEKENAFVTRREWAQKLDMTEPCIETIVVEGLTIRYRRARRPGAGTVVVNAAWPQSLMGFRDLWPLLAAERDVVALELPGFGLSDGCEGVMRPSAQAELLVRFLDALALARVHVLALDVGVPAALFALARHADRFTGATLANGPGCGAVRFSPALALLARSAFVRSALACAPALFVRIADRQGHRRSTTDAGALADYVACHKGARLARTFKYLASYSDPSELPALDRELSCVDVPVRIFWGTDDVYLPVENAHALAARLPTATLTLLDGVGHFSHDDAPVDLARHVLSASL